MPTVENVLERRHHHDRLIGRRIDHQIINGIDHQTVDIDRRIEDIDHRIVDIEHRPGIGHHRGKSCPRKIRM